jgi:hypothetical protein
LIIIPRLPAEFLFSELLAKATSSVIPANPGSGPGQAPESIIAGKYWIPGRAALARNDDLLFIPKVSQESQLQLQSSKKCQKCDVY